jgi:hypothetical protein
MEMEPGFWSGLIGGLFLGVAAGVFIMSLAFMSGEDPQ